jgi:VanZ family protein
VILYCALIFGLSSVSHVPNLPGGLNDKTGHLLLYSGLGFLVTRALTRGASRLSFWIVLGTVALVAAYGLSDETHQLFVPMRTFDLKDLLADAVGAACGTGAYGLWGIIGPGSRGSRPV